MNLVEDGMLTDAGMDLAMQIQDQNPGASIVQLRGKIDRNIPAEVRLLLEEFWSVSNQMWLG
jgi:hypothetical protein